MCVVVGLRLVLYVCECCFVCVCGFVWLVFVVVVLCLV